jgi:hypothetical protein
LPVTFNRFFNYLIDKAIAYCQISFLNRDYYNESVRNIRALIKYNLILYYTKFTTILKAYIKEEKNDNFLIEIYQLRRIIDELTDIYAVLKNVVNYYFVISILLPADC